MPQWWNAELQLDTPGTCAVILVGLLPCTTNFWGSSSPMSFLGGNSAPLISIETTLWGQLRIYHHMGARDGKTHSIYSKRASLIAQLVKGRVGKIPWRRDRLPIPVFLGIPCGSAGKESACNVGDLGLIPGLGRSPGEGKGYPLQCSDLENYIFHEVAKSWTWLSDLKKKKTKTQRCLRKQLGSHMKIGSTERRISWDSPCGPVAKIPCSLCRGHRFDPWSGNWIPHAATKSLHAAMKNQRSHTTGHK